MSGLVITAVALWSILWKHQFISLMAEPLYPLASYGLLAAGLFATLTALFGCYAVWRDQRSLVCCVSVFTHIVIYAQRKKRNLIKKSMVIHFL